MCPGDSLKDLGWTCGLLEAKLRERNLKIFKVFFSFTESNAASLLPSFLVAVLNPASKALRLRKYRDRRLSASPPWDYHIRDQSWPAPERPNILLVLISS